MFRLIKWLVKTLLVFTGLLPLLRCSSGYQEKNGKKTFNGREITDKNFQVLNEAFAKDSLYAYYKEKSITGADVASFTAISDEYAKDKNRVYYCDESRDGKTYYTTKYQKIIVVERADPASFTLAGAGYAKDKIHGFYAGKYFPVNDIASLTGMNSHFAKDHVQAYYNCRPIPGSDGKTFEMTGDFYAKDTHHIYFYKPLETVKESVFVLPCHRASFIQLAYPFSKDDNSVFYEQQLLNGANAGSFTVLEQGYSKDNHAVYVQTKKIAGADPASFEIFKDDGQLTQDDYYSRDKTSIYWFAEKLSVADPALFKPLGHGYATNGKFIFYKTGIVKNADATSFKVYPHDFGNADATDATTSYHSGKKVTADN